MPALRLFSTAAHLDPPRHPHAPDARAPGPQVFRMVHKMLGDVFPLTAGDYDSAVGFELRGGRLAVLLKSGDAAALKRPEQFAGYLAGPDGALTSVRPARSGPARAPPGTVSARRALPCGAAPGPALRTSPRVADAPRRPPRLARAGPRRLRASLPVILRASVEGGVSRRRRGRHRRRA